MKLTLPPAISTSFRLKSLAILMLLMSIGQKAAAQVNLYSYSGSNSGQTFTALSTYTVVPLGTAPNYINWDDQLPVQIPIGFTFNFNGNNYTDVYVSPNGYITFGAAAATNNYTPISTAGAYAGVVAGFAGNLSNNGVAIRYNTTATSPKSFTVEYNAVRVGQAGSIKFQIVLNETTNTIDVRHGSVGANFSTTTTYHQIGLRGSSVADWNNLSRTVTTTGNWPAGLGDFTSSAISPPGAVTSTVTTTRLTTAFVSTKFTWTPPVGVCPAPTYTSSSSVSGTQQTINWSPPGSPPSAGYDYYYSTSSTAPTSGTTPSGSVGAGVLTANLTTSAHTTYYVWVRSNCGSGNYSSWSNMGTFTTVCDPDNVPYFQYFDPPPSPATLSYCTSVAGTGTAWIRANADSASMTEGFFDEHMEYNASASTANAWFFTGGINLVAGTTYKLSYGYGCSTNFSDIVNKMQVSYGTSATIAGMTIPLVNQTSIKVPYTQAYINFTPASSGVYYFGFKCYSDPNMGKLFLDDIEITVPGCKPVSGLGVTNITANSALVNWTAPSPAPSNGYNYYLTTTNPNQTAGSFITGAVYQILTSGTTNFTLIGAADNNVGTTFTATGPGAGTGTATMITPSYLQVATGSAPAGTPLVTLNGLTGSTTYYMWVNSSCGIGDYSQWSSVISFTTLTQPVYCTPVSADTIAAITNVTTTGGVANINNTTTYTAGGYANYTSQFVSQSPGNSVNFSIMNSNISLGAGISVWVDWNNNGTFSAAEKIATSDPNYVYGGPFTGVIAVPAGQAIGDYRMRIMNDYWTTDPGSCTFTNPGFGLQRTGEAEDYTFRVTTPAPPLTLNIYSSVQCAGTNSPTITLQNNNFNVYSWSPSTGVTEVTPGNYVINSGTTINYVLTGTQTVAPFATRSVTFAYTANPLPTPITIAPAAATSCQTGPAVQLTASGGVVSGVPVMSENFNSGPGAWTTANAGSGGIVANADWTIRSDGYVPAGPSWGSTDFFHSNDNTAFYFTDADNQRIGSFNDTRLTSPVFSLSGYTAASLSFWHFFDVWGGAVADVQLSTDGGVTWPITLSSFNTPQGEKDDFSHVIIDMNPYVGMTNLRLRFRHTANWGWGWAVDNVVLSGSASSAITWTPITGLYMDANHTIPYNTGDTSATVYAMPGTTTTYTASASTIAPVCTSQKTVIVTVTPLVPGTASPDQIGACNGISDVTLTGNSQTPIRWEYDTTNTFPAPTAVPSSASNTLTAAQIGTFAGTRYYRAVVQNGASCIGYSTYVTISFSTTTYTGTWSNGLPSSTKAAIFASGTYSSTGNLSACSVTVTGGNVTFNSGHTLTVQNGVTVTGGTLTFNDSSSLVQINDAAVNSGYITYKRDAEPMVQFDYTYWSSPLTPQTLVGLSPLTLYDKYFQYVASSESWQNVAGNSLMDAGRGYIVRAPQGYTSSAQTFTGIFNGGSNDGVPNNGIIQENIVGSGHFNLIGNPYPSAMDADAFYAANNTLIDGNFYFWTHNTPIDPLQYTESDYAQYNSTGGIGTAGGGSGNLNAPDENIASGQGFFVVGIAPGTAVFNNSMRVGGSNGNFFRLSGQQSPQSVEKHRIWLEMKNDAGAYKQTLVGYVQGATNARDLAFDGDSADGGTAVLLYSIVGTDKLGIQGRALPFDVNDMVQLGYRSNAAGNFEIAMPMADGLFADTSRGIYLEDKLLNVIHNLRNGGYSFATAAGTFDTRFVLRYTDGTALGIDNPVFNEESVVVYKNDSGLHINTSNINMDNVKVFDIRGRLILGKTNINSNETTISNLNVARQVLIVRIESDDKRVVNKKVVY